MREPYSPLPITILTGFLGAGKTTLLRRILANPQGVRYGVLVNDFGTVNIDAELIVESTADQVSLANGCVCCTIRNDLIDAISGFLDIPERPDQLIVEASGISRPLPIVEALEAGTLKGQAVLNGIFCLIDGACFTELDFATTELALDQALGADLIILNKIDIASPQQLATIETTLRGPLPHGRIVRTSHANVPRDILFGAHLRKLEDSFGTTVPNRVPDDTQGGDHHNHGDEFQSWHWSSSHTVDPSRLRSAVRSLPASVMRAKGVFRLPGEGSMRLVFHLVGKKANIIRENGLAPDQSIVVAIAQQGGFDPEALTESFNRCIYE